MFKMFKSVITPNQSNITAVVKNAQNKYQSDLNRAEVRQKFFEDLRISLVILRICKKLKREGKTDLTMKDLEFLCGKNVKNSFPQVYCTSDDQSLGEIPVKHTGVLGRFITKVTEAGLLVGYNWIQSNDRNHWLVEGLHITFKVDTKVDDKIDTIGNDDEEDNLFDR